MALDTLQLSPTVINTDKLVQAAGNLMAKEKAEAVAREKAMADQLAKIDSSKLRSSDIKEFNQLYNDFIAYGAENKNKMNNVEVQAELARKINGLRGFVDLSARTKEQYDIPLTSRKYDKDLDPNAGLYIDEIIATPTSQLKPIDLNKITNVDKKDYLTEWMKGLGGVTLEKNGTTYKNTAEVFTEIGKKAVDYTAATSSTDLFNRALNQYAKINKINLSDPNATEEQLKEIRANAIEGMTNEAARYKLSAGDSSTTKEKQPAMSASERDYLAGFKLNKASSYDARLREIEKLYKGNPAALAAIVRYMPNAKISGDANSPVITITTMEEVDNNGVKTMVPTQYVLNKRDPEAFVIAANSLYSKLGNQGWENIKNEEMVSYTKATKWQPPSINLPAVKRSDFAKNKGVAKEGDKDAKGNPLPKKGSAPLKAKPAAPKKIEAVVDDNKFLK